MFYAQGVELWSYFFARFARCASCPEKEFNPLCKGASILGWFFVVDSHDGVGSVVSCIDSLRGRSIMFGPASSMMMLISESMLFSFALKRYLYEPPLSRPSISSWVSISFIFIFMMVCGYGFIRCGFVLKSHRHDLRFVCTLPLFIDLLKNF